MADSVYVGEKESITQQSFENRARLLNNMAAEKQKMDEIIKEKEHKSPFEKFYQVNTENNQYLTELATKQPKALAILLYIFENMDNYNALIASYKVFEERFDLSQSTVKRCIKYLKDHGYLYIYKSGVTNVYVANNNLVWKSYGKNTKYCQFPANVILSASEQQKKVPAKIKKQRLTAITVNEQKNNTDSNTVKLSDNLDDDDDCVHEIDYSERYIKSPDPDEIPNVIEN